MSGPVPDGEEPRRLRYTVSRHDTGSSAHYDLFLESSPGGSLRTWRLDAPPESGDVAAEALPEHRAVYLDFEGEISGGRGRVAVHATGFGRLSGRLLTLNGGPSAGIYVFADGRLVDPRRHEV